MDDMIKDDDIVISSNGFKLSVAEHNGKFIGEFIEDDEAEYAIIQFMNKNDYWPDVWFVSDHGNVSPYKFDLYEH
ncbi:MAG: hypothetical protein ACLFT4_09115 [Bacteroidales bacterium]